MKIVNTVSEELIQARLDDGTNVVTAKLSHGEWSVLLNPNLSIKVKNRDEAEKVVEAIGSLVTDHKSRTVINGRDQLHKAAIGSRWMSHWNNKDGTYAADYALGGNGWRYRVRGESQWWTCVGVNGPQSVAFPLTEVK